MPKLLFAAFATMRSSCLTHTARLILRLLCCSCRGNVEWISMIVSCSSICRGGQMPYKSYSHGSLEAFNRFIPIGDTDLP